MRVPDRAQRRYCKGQASGRAGQIVLGSVLTWVAAGGSALSPGDEVRDQG